eukprot:jgi/Ulvmu1/2056/UM120_0052.1
MTAELATSEEHLEIYQASSWHPNFRSVCFKTAYVDLPGEVLSFLEADGISSRDVPLAVPPTASGSDSEEVDEGQSGNSHQRDHASNLDQFKQRVNSAIRSLGGRVVPKLNWSAPVDAQWISPTGLSCQNADEILLLLKSSDRAAHDLACVHQLQQGMHVKQPSAPAGDVSSSPQDPADPGNQSLAVRPQLVLKRYHEMDHGMEFRCFVHSGCLAGISQRDPTQQFPGLLDEQPAIKAALLEFYASSIASRFQSTSYVYDVYVTPKKRVWLLDINPAGGTTQPLLFTWPELRAAAERMQHLPHGEAGCELRVVTDHMHVQAGAQSVFGVPADTLELQGMTWGDVMQHLASEVSKQNLQDG